MSKSVLLFIMILSLPTVANEWNRSDLSDKKSEHPMSGAWAHQPLIGLCGVILNSFVLYMGYCERQTFIKPVNAMIW